MTTLEQFRTAKAVLGVDGISVDAGLSVTDPAVAASKQKMMQLSNQIIFMCDHTKLNQVCLIPIARLEEIDYLVTDSNVSAETVAAIEACGPKVILASAANEEQ